MTSHADCTIHEPCQARQAASCPLEPHRRRRAGERQGAWSPLELRREPSGPRHYLDGKPVHCGDGVELQALEYRHDDYGEYTVPVQRGVAVRYEARLVDPPTVSLHHLLEGHAFSSSLTDGMRFRWPR